MSAHIADLASDLVACAIDMCWHQWRALASTGPAVDEPLTRSIVDPEALVLLTLALRQHERRLDDQVRWWAAAGSSLMSVQRMRTLLSDHPPELAPELARFAAMAVAAGDPRWRVLASPSTAEVGGRPGKGPRELQLFAPSTLLLRLRAGFGVGAKADLLAFLLGMAKAPRAHAPRTNVEVIAAATSYSIASIRRATKEMVLGGMLRESVDRPVEFSVDVGSWARLLKLPRAVSNKSRTGDADFEVPPWRCWAQMFSFILAVVGLVESSRFRQAAAVVQASRLRDLAERFRRPLSWNGIEWLDPRRFPGESYLAAFKATVDAVVAWVAERH